MGTEQDFLDALDCEKSVVIVKALDAYKAKHGINEELDTEQIVDAASDPASPLHKYFDWDNDSAGHKHRLATARQLISRVRFIVRNEGTVTYRAFVSVKQSPADKRRYERISRVLNEQSLQRARLADLQRRLAGYLSEFADVPDEWLEPIRQLRDQLTEELAA